MANPNDIRVLFDQALRKHQAGHYGSAEKLYRRILDKQPKHRDSLHLLGVLRLTENKPNEAVMLIEKALGLGNDVAAICFNLARAYEENGQLDPALALFERAQRLDPRDPDIAFGIGTVLSSQTQYHEAILAFNRALLLSPRHVKALNNRGVAFKNLDRFDEALDSYTAALAIDPQHVETHLNRAALLETRYRLEEAQDSYKHILRFYPKHAQALFQFGKNYSIQKQHGEAIEKFTSATLIEPSNYEYLAHLMVERSKICDWGGFEKNHDALRRGLTRTATRVPPLSIARLYDAPDLMLKVAQSFSARKGPSERQHLTSERKDGCKIRLGYVSSDLHARHPVYQALEGVLRHHDRSRFEIHYFKLPASIRQPTPDVLTAFGDTVHELGSGSLSELLAHIRSVKLDIAIDLNGFTKFHKVELFKAGIAPLHVNYLGSPGSMGSTFHDYIIGDANVIREEAFQHYSEQVVWMPKSFFPVNNVRPITSQMPTRAAAGLPEQGIVFGFFGTVDRIMPPIFAGWMSILKSVENSVLWLKTDNTLTRNNIWRAVEKTGVSSDRIIFADRVESNADHLARLALMDLCLDTLPYNAHMTGLDCLFAGVPLLTVQGNSFAARVASSLLHASGLAELICADRKSYEEMAIKLALAPELLASLKSKLQLARNTTPLFDTAAYTRDFEKALSKMFERSIQGLPPRHFKVV